MVHELTKHAQNAYLKVTNFEMPLTQPILLESSPNHAQNARIYGPLNDNY